jgi:hypothetical protein
MLNPDQKETVVDEIKKAYQSLKFYDDTKNEQDMDDFVHTTFSLNEHMIYKVSEILELQSGIKERMQNSIQKSRNRSQRIKELEESLGEISDVESFKKNIQSIKKKIFSIWNTKGFSNRSDFFITQYGDIHISLGLTLLRDVWDLEDDEQENSDKLLKKYQQNAFHSGLKLLEEERYFYVQKNDHNEDILTDLISQCFPGAEILDFNRRKTRRDFILTEVKISLSDVSFLEG